MSISVSERAVVVLVVGVVVMMVCDLLGIGIGIALFVVWRRRVDGGTVNANA